jgi:hypothetical protein
MKAACVYQLKDRFLVHAESRTTAGVWLASEPFLVLPNHPTFEEIGKALLQALDNSSNDAPHPVDWKAVHAPRLAAAGVKTERSFQEGAKLVRVSSQERQYIIEPYLNGGASGDSKGFHAIATQRSAVPSDVSSVNLGANVFEALKLCSCAA